MSLPPTLRMKRKSVKQTLEQSGSLRISRVTEHIHTRLQQSLPQWKQLLILITLVIINVRIGCLFVPATDGSVGRVSCMQTDGTLATRMPTTQDASTAPVPSRNSEKINDKTVNDKYLHCISGCDWGNDLNSDIEVFLQQLHYFEMKNSDVASCHGVKGRY